MLFSEITCHLLPVPSGTLLASYTQQHETLISSPLDRDIEKHLKESAMLQQPQLAVLCSTLADA